MDDYKVICIKFIDLPGALYSYASEYFLFKIFLADMFKL